jgi:hypothetical protein
MSDSDSESDRIEISKTINCYTNIKDIKTEKNSLRIVQINARSINNKLDELKYINYIVGSAEIISVSETWIKKCNEDSVKLNNYNVICASREKVTGDDTYMYDMVSDCKMSVTVLYFRIMYHTV